jgi:hypothetical protein
MTVEAYMDEPSAVMERETQEGLEHALSTSDLPDGARKLTDQEARLALARLGRHPAKLRTAALAIMPHTPRLILLGAGMIDYEEGDRPRWVLTELGQKAAEALAAATSQLSEQDRQRADADLDALLAEAESELQAPRSSDSAADTVAPSPAARGRTRWLLDRLRRRTR